MFDFFSKLLGGEKSSNVAKERLKLVLIHDRNDISPETLESIRIEMIDTLKKYLEIDEHGIEMQLDRQNRSVALVASIPLKTMKRGAPGQPKGQPQKAARGQKK